MSMRNILHVEKFNDTSLTDAILLACLLATICQKLKKYAFLVGRFRFYGYSTNPPICKVRQNEFIVNPGILKRVSAFSIKALLKKKKHSCLGLTVHQS